jgi:DNA-binding transcriptional LysR family regulator
MAGLGLAQLPRFGTMEHLAAGTLEEVMPDLRPAAMPVSVVYAHNRQMSPRVRAFVDWIASVLVI